MPIWVIWYWQQYLVSPWLTLCKHYEILVHVKVCLTFNFLVASWLRKRVTNIDFSFRSWKFFTKYTKFSCQYHYTRVGILNYVLYCLVFVNLCKQNFREFLGIPFFFYCSNVSYHMQNKDTLVTFICAKYHWTTFYCIEILIIFFLSMNAGEECSGPLIQSLWN
jgi:hypothetical protein